jgi:rhamnosyltransferase
MIKFPLGFVLYKPSLDSINRITEYANMGIIIFIYDNSETSNYQLIKQKNIYYFTNKKNEGISFALDFLSKKILEYNFNYFLFFDQDTIFSFDTLKYINNCVDCVIEKHNTIYLSTTSINFRDKSVLVNKYNLIKTEKIENYLLHFVYYTINSGTIYFLKNLNSFEWFDRQYFVDGVDYSFSLNSYINKYNNIIITNVPGLNHFDEQGDSTISLFGIKITSRVYPLKRNIDFLVSHSRLFIKTFKIQKINPKIFILKALFSYILTQIYFRILFSFKKVVKL